MGEPLRYLDVCSGYSAATLAWRPLGWQCAGYSEIEPFPRAILEQRWGAVPADWDHRYVAGRNSVPLFGDFTRIEPEHVGPIDLLVGGTPCQSFSHAGKRLGLDDPRGHLTLEFLALARRLRVPRLVWENVPGVLSHDGGRTFGTFLGLLGQLGYRWAYRVLDAQYVRVAGFGRAVPQRRRRVFVVGYLGDAGPHPAAVLFDRESLRGNPAPRREAGKGVAGHPGASAAFGGENTSGLTARGQRIDFEVETFVAHTLRGEGFDASEDGTGRGVPLVPVAFDLRGREGGSQFEGPHDTANIRAASGGSSRSYVADHWAVRRLMPVECERLQGVPDDFTRIAWRGKPPEQCPDGPRYRAIGNSMAVNCMRWIGERIAAVDALRQEMAA